MNRKLAGRIVFDIVLGACVFFGWWHVGLLVGFCALWLFPYYAELVLAGLAFDALYGMNDGQGIWGYAGVLAAIVLMAIVAAFTAFIRR